MALRPVDKLVAGYLALVTVVMVVRGSYAESSFWWLIAMHGLVGLLLFVADRLESRHKLGRAMYVLYPIIITPALYSELGILTLQTDVLATLAHDAILQEWDIALFGRQVSYDWIRNSPSVFWSGVLHLAYFAYYPIVVLGPILLLARGREPEARRVVLATMIAFVSCYVVFLLFPVAGPNYALSHPTGPVRDVWSARLVYWVLDGGSAFGTAFPSSHVAATAAVVMALWSQLRALAVAFILPALLLLVGTVYCQMHYGVDAIAGLAVGIGAGWVGSRVPA